MPKVTEKYLANKKNYILECTGDILKEKPLYSITMRDIIKKAGFSQGTIYHYYTSLDDIFIDYINNNTTYNLLEEHIDNLLASSQMEEDILFKCIIAIGKYIEELLKSIGGKTCFEFIVLYTYDFEKRSLVFPKLKFKQSLEYAQYKIMEFTVNNVEKGIFRPQIPIDSLSMFVSNFIDGIAQSTANVEEESNISEMFQILARAMIGFLGD